MPLKLYLTEIKWRLFYCSLSFMFCFCTLILFIDIFFILEVKPLVTLGHKNFIATQVTDFFTAVLLVCSFFSQLSTFPVIAHHVYYFFAPSFYASQLFFLRRCIFYSSLIYISSFLMVHFFLASNILLFLIQWGSFINSDLLNLELDVRIKEYLYWVNGSYNLTSTVLQNSSILTSYLVLSFNTETLFNYLKLYRKHLSFILLFCFYTVLPPDLVLQLYFFLFALFSVEFLFYVICFRLKQTNPSW